MGNSTRIPVADATLPRLTHPGRDARALDYDDCTMAVVEPTGGASVTSLLFSGKVAIVTGGTRGIGAAITWSSLVSARMLPRATTVTPSPRPNA